MLGTRIKVRLIAFVVIGLLATGYLAVNYVGVNLFGSGYDITVALPNAGGSFKNGEVTYQGVPVGRIKELTATHDGAVAKVHIDGDAPSIPADVSVTVANRSAFGEQYLDLTASSPASTKTTMLTAGDRLTGGADSQPPAIAEVLRSGRDFVGSVPADSLRTVIDETYDASQGVSGPVSRLIRTSQQFADTATANFLSTAGLIQNSTRVLTTQQQASASIKGFSTDLDLFAQTLRSNDQSLRALITDAPAAARQIGQLFDDVGTPLGVLMSNLVSTAQVFGTNAAGVEDALIRVPEAFSVGWAVNGSQGLSLGLAQTYFDPLPCTSGYGGTQVRKGLDTSTGNRFNTSAGCSLSPSSGVDVRGPNSVPKGARPAARVSTPATLEDLLGGAR